MPLYIFKCEKCQKEFEVIQKMSDKNPSCPFCKNEKTDKMLTSAGFNIKGVSHSSSCSGGGCGCH